MEVTGREKLRGGADRVPKLNYAALEEDVDEDADIDLLFHFKTQELALDGDSTEAALTGATTDGDPIVGSDSVRIVPPKGKKNS